MVIVFGCQGPGQWALSGRTVGLGSVLGVGNGLDPAEPAVGVRTFVGHLIAGMQRLCELLNGAPAAKRYDRDCCEAGDHSNCEHWIFHWRR
jgi:hypothetical protein